MPLGMRVCLRRSRIYRFSVRSWPLMVWTRSVSILIMAALVATSSAPALGR